MRIISGECRGRKLVKIQGNDIRPTSDRVREAVFNILGSRIQKTEVLDLFAGTGAMGIEALSRGAAHAVFIDLSCDVIHENLQLCGFTGRTDVFCCDIIKENLPEKLYENSFDFIFIDPPYGKKILEHIFQTRSFLNLIKKDSIVVAEQSFREKLDIKNTGLNIYRQKKYSKTVISFITAADNSFE